MFVRFQDVVTNDKVPSDAVYQKINCVRFIWERYGEKNGKEGVGNEYSLCQLDYIRGYIHSVCVQDILECVFNSYEYKRSLNRTIGGIFGTHGRKSFFV